MERETAAGIAGKTGTVSNEEELFTTQAFREISACKSGLRVLVNSLGDGVLILDMESRVLLANPSFLEMLQYDGAQVVGKLFHEICVHLQLREMVLQSLKKHRAVEVDLVLAGEEGSDRIVTMKSQPFMDTNNQVLGGIIVLRDSTDTVKNNRLKSDFVAMVSHEIRSPMNSLMAQIQVILDGLAGEVTERQREILERVSGKVSSLVNMVSKLLDLATIEAGLPDSEMEDVDMRELLVEQIEFHSPFAAEKHMQLVSKIDHISATVWGNRQGLEMVFTNLLTNAIKYSPADSTITLTAKQQGEHLKVKVVDTGVGIREEDLTHIFERFYRVKNNDPRTIHGTGLGLAIVRSIVEVHQGSIDVESIPGAGTTFTVQLPVKMECL